MSGVTLEFQPVQHSSDALVIGQPRHMATAVIRMFQAQQGKMIRAQQYRKQ